jgi:hypothetical protein
MAILKIKNWERFQHYKHRNPPWIKLHRELLSSETWVLLSDASRVLAIALMLLAGGNDNHFEDTEDSKRYIKRVAYLDDTPNFEPLIKCGFLEYESDIASNMQADASNGKPSSIKQNKDINLNIDENKTTDASAMLASCKPMRTNADPELETETETELYIKETLANANAKKKQKPTVTPEVLEIFEHWKFAMIHPQAKLDEKRRTAIARALKLGYAVESLKVAIDGCKADPWHMGANDRKKRFDGLTMILRDAEHIDKFISLGERPLPGSKINFELHEKIKQAYREILEPLGECRPLRHWTGADASNLQTIIDSNPLYQNFETWRDFFIYISNLKKLTGEQPLSNGNRFKLTLSYIVQEKNFAAIYNGVWDNE